MRKIVSTLALALVAFNAQADACLKRHGALDIGTGSTKAYAAVVDVCAGRMVEILYDRQIQLGFGEALAKSKNNEISSQMIGEASGEIKKLVDEMKKKDVQRISAVATAAFRTAKNGAKAAGDLGKRTNLDVKVLSQDEEAEFGALSARVLGGVAKEDVRFVVWDIGGGSMQMWAKDKESGAHIYKGDLASVNFKNRVISEILKQDLKKVDSPNPLNAKYEEAVQLAEGHARANVTEFFKKDAAKYRWLGIGGVLAISLKNQVNPKSGVLTREQLKRVLVKRSKLKDSDIDSKYRATEITNMALVLGYMQALGIDKVDLVEASLVQGALF